MMQGVMKKVLAVLKPEQLAEWTKLTGPPFKDAFDFPPGPFVEGLSPMVVRPTVPRRTVFRIMVPCRMAPCRMVHRLAALHRVVFHLTAVRGCSRRRRLCFSVTEHLILQDVMLKHNLLANGLTGRRAGKASLSCPEIPAAETIGLTVYATAPRTGRKNNSSRRFFAASCY